MAVLLGERWLAWSLAFLAFCAVPAEARAQTYCPVDGYFDPAMPARVFTAPSSWVGAGLDGCTAEGTACGSPAGSVCRRLGADAWELFCVSSDPLWACNGGCSCPVIDGTMSSVRNLDLGGGTCLCQQQPDVDYCALDAPSLTQFVACHTAPASAGMMRVLVSWHEGDCDGDGLPNGCEGTGDSCDACLSPPMGDCPGFTYTRPARCGTDAGIVGRSDAGPPVDAERPDAATPGVDAGASPDMDAGISAIKPTGLQFRGGGGAVCSVGAPGTGTTPASRARVPASVALAAAALALLAVRARRRRRAPPRDRLTT